MPENDPASQSRIRVANPTEISQTLLVTGLGGHTSEAASGLLLDLKRHPQSVYIPTNVAVEISYDLLMEHAASVASRIQSSYIETVHTGYPDDFTNETYHLESPRQHAKASGLAGLRRQFKDAYDPE